jgi:hypothetical protein
MSWTERRSILVKMAETEPGWGCVRIVHERHVGRVLMTRKYGHRSGFYAVGTREYEMINTSSASWQRAQTSRMK